MLVEQIRSDGYPVESYQFPFIADERLVGSSILQRATGLVDVSVDREVWMLYSSFFRPHGAGIISSYADEAQAVALGSTGGGVDHDLTAIPIQPLSWDEFARDLRLAWYYCDDLFIFSLEGCVQQGFLERLRSFEWDYPILLPEASRSRVDSLRATLRSGLWLSANFYIILMSVLGVILLLKGVSKFINRNRA
jgi:hypothetical protein